MSEPVFVYEKDGIIQVLPLSDESHKEKAAGWRLIASLDPVAYIKILLFKYPALVRILDGGSV